MQETTCIQLVSETGWFYAKLCKNTQMTHNDVICKNDNPVMASISFLGSRAMGRTYCWSMFGRSC